MAAAAFGIGIVVGLTGMGGGALMTPVLVLFFGIQPLAAVSSDLVAAAVMKPVGSFVHLRRGTVNASLVMWLCLGSVPTAFTGVLVARSFGDGEAVQHAIQKALGVALLIAVAGIVIRAYTQLVERAAERGGHVVPQPENRPEVRTRRLATVAVGAVGGLIVGMTSVGSGSLIIIALMALYPTLKANQLVGTDLVQAVPLVFSAAFGHLLFGDFNLALTLALIIGSVPGAWLGAHLSSRAPGGLIRCALGFVLLASALKLLGTGTELTGLILLIVLVTGPALWILIRRRHGFAALGRESAARPYPDPDQDRALDPAKVGVSTSAERQPSSTERPPSDPQ
jgi:uncharacterized membrane protein YfcA